ncbi:hypothetical protein GB931_16140 [Modestobacter sp. I12A-02628]|uniref:Polysaccharide biosynthesis protein n=1 Tax=Goekera deserti TaxID=2497753 RepID=A0A7K3WJB8_9ACTN|nr:hypothetical protein [Goekera deserti]MPQ99420.1 hypothetical protein [Goekera deserti]NDI48907.1 hypothetical protein [Goekera deserti]NEL55623.1 hypothetical protein [Goekera deserti]
MAAPSEAGQGPAGVLDDEAGAARPRMPWARVTSFVGLPLISLLGSVAVIPVISSVGGAPGWAAVALGQAIGTGVATVLQYGWGFVGPTLVVGLDGPGRAQLLWVSTLARLLVGAVVFPVGAVAAALLAPDGYAVLAALTAVALGTVGLSAHWFFVGTGRPGREARYETIPRLAVQLVSVVAVLVTRDPFWYPAVLLCGQLVITATLTRRLSEPSLSRRTWSQAWGSLRTQRTSAATDVVVAVVNSAPMSILAAVAPGSLAAFAAGDRVQRLAQAGVQPVYHAFQGWVSETADLARGRRMRLAVTSTGTAGLLAGTAIGLGLPVVDRWLFAGAVAVDPRVSLLFGAALASWAVVSAVTFDVLAPLGMSRTILASTATSGLLTVAGVAVLAPSWGAAGGALALLLAQLGALVVQVTSLRRGSTRDAGGAGTPSAPARPR